MSDGSIKFKITVDPKAPIIFKTPEEQYAEFKALIEAYKKQNPAKYEKKKEALEKKLNALLPAKKAPEKPEVAGEVQKPEKPAKK